METVKGKRYLFTIGLIAALVMLILPAAAVNGTISIAYRGSGGSYIGDPVIFDGKNTFSNVTLVRMTGPGLPPEGVPVYDVNGQAGSGNTIQVNPDGIWKLVWYTNNIKGWERLETARYYITAFDSVYPEQTSTTSILLKRPEFYVVVTPPSGRYGDYVQLTGTVEKGSSSVYLNIADSTGKVVHSYDSTVSGSGYFNKGFHIDMPAGVYTVTLSTPSGRSSYTNYLVVNQSADGPMSPTAGEPGEPVSVVTPEPPAGPGSLSISSNPAGATVFIDGTMAGSTPYTQDGISAGTHLVEVKAPGFATYSQQVEIRAGAPATVSAPLARSSSSALPLSIIPVLAGLIIVSAVVLASSGSRKN